MSGVCAPDVRIGSDLQHIQAGPNGGITISLRARGIFTPFPRNHYPGNHATRCSCARDCPDHQPGGGFLYPPHAQDKEQFMKKALSSASGKASILGGSGKGLCPSSLSQHHSHHERQKAVNALGAEGIQTKIITCSLIKPLFGQEAVIKSCTGTRAVITLENHNILNGLGSCSGREVIAE